MPFIRSVIRWLNKGAEGVAAAMLAALFLTFVLQIFSRYVLATPFGWTLELCLTLWVWIVFWGNAFIVKEHDHVKFDVFYLAVPPGFRRVLALISAAAIVAGLVISLLPTLDYIDFLKIKKSPLLKIPLRTVFSIYMVFMLAIILVYTWRFISVWRLGAPEDRRNTDAPNE